MTQEPGETLVAEDMNQASSIERIMAVLKRLKHSAASVLIQALTPESKAYRDESAKAFFSGDNISQLLALICRDRRGLKKVLDFVFTDGNERLESVIDTEADELKDVWHHVSKKSDFAPFISLDFDHMEATTFSKAPILSKMLTRIAQSARGEEFNIYKSPRRVSV